MIRQFYRRGITLPKPGEIRELTTSRGGVEALARVKSVDKDRRLADLQIMHLDWSGKEKR